MEELEQIAEFNHKYLHGLIQLDEYENAAQFYGLHFAGENRDTGVNPVNKAYADVLMAEVSALMGNKKRAMEQLGEVYNDLPDYADYPNIVLHAGLTYIFSGGGLLGVERITQSLKDMSDMTANLQYHYVLKRLERYYTGKGETPAENRYYQDLMALPYAETYEDVIKQAKKLMSDEMKELLNPAARWQMKYVQ